MKHVVMPRKENTDEIYDRRELQAKKNAAADRYHAFAARTGILTMETLPDVKAVAST